MNSRGFFITLEGGEGCGKSTQLKLLAEALPKRTGRELIFTRSPGGTPVAEEIRTILKTRNPQEDLRGETELLLFGACHSQMAETLIRPALNRGAIVISDRFYDSTTVYQGYARGLDLGFVKQINTFACGGLTPDKTILLDIEVEKGMERTRKRAGGQPPEEDRFDAETLDFHHAIRNGFLGLARLEPQRFSIVDAAQSPEQTHQKIMEALDELGLF